MRSICARGNSRDHFCSFFFKFQEAIFAIFEDWIQDFLYTKKSFFLATKYKQDYIWISD